MFENKVVLDSFMVDDLNVALDNVINVDMMVVGSAGLEICDGKVTGYDQTRPHAITIFISTTKEVIPHRLGLTYRGGKGKTPASIVGLTYRTQ